MIARDLLKRTPIRLAATFTTLFIAAVVSLFAILYVSLAAELTNQIRSHVEETSDALFAIDQAKGFDELTAVVASESDSIRNDDTILLLVDADGKFSAGNVRGIAVSQGWLTLPRHSLTFISDKGEPPDQFHAKWLTVSKGHLLVGASDKEVRRTSDLLLRWLGWSLAATLLLSGLCGAFLARQAQRRINELSNTLLLVSQGRLDARVTMSGSGDDIDHIGEQINRTLRQLKVLVDNVNQSSSDIAHDLKVPIGRLHQNLDQTLRTAISPAQFRSALDAALIDLEQIIETFEALLSISQIEAGARKKRFRVVDLRQVVADVMDAYEAVAEDAGYRLEFATKMDGAALVRGDHELLVQLFANLVENAIRHCPSGTLIKMCLFEQAGEYEIVVADNGPGIPANERENVLRRLYRLERARTTPGNGLGLSLVSAIADLHDAPLSLGDNGPGLTVTIRFSNSAP